MDIVSNVFLADAREIQVLTFNRLVTEKKGTRKLESPFLSKESVHIFHLIRQNEETIHRLIPLLNFLLDKQEQIDPLRIVVETRFHRR